MWGGGGSPKFGNGTLLVAAEIHRVNRNLSKSRADPERRIAEAPRLPWQPGGNFFPCSTNIPQTRPRQARSGRLLARKTRSPGLVTGGTKIVY